MYIDTNVQLAIAAARQVCGCLVPPAAASPTALFGILYTQQSSLCGLTGVSQSSQLSQKAGLRVHILVPDQTEYNRSYKL